MTDAEIAAAGALAGEIGVFKFRDAVAAKGDAARLHAGITVQRAMAIMTEHGLEPLRYAFVCYDEWDAVAATPPVYDEEGRLVAPSQEARPAGSLYSLRSDELGLFIARGLAAGREALETRVAALEARAA